MALNIRPSSDTSSSSSSSSSSSKKNSSTDLFAQGMAFAAKQQQTQHAKQPAPPPKPSKPASTAKPKSDDSDSKAASSNTGANSKPKASSSAASQSANAKSGQAGSSADDASSPADGAAAADAAAAAANSAKGRAPVRTPSKGQDVAAKAAEDASADPTADDANQSGLSLIQLLAKSLESDKTDTTATDATDSAVTDEAPVAGKGKASDDPNAIALAVFSQSLAAALARQQTASAAPATSGDATTGITSATDSPSGTASMQDLMTVLAHDIAADAKGKSDGAAAQTNVDPTKSAAADASGTDPNALTPNALAHLGAASHFAQHLRTDTNTADIQSPVGTSAWQDEIGTHLTWMTQKGLETGSLRVNPEHLGPVEVNIAVQNGDASVWFAASHPDARAALEQALPRLREMFANQGMNLADSGVSRQSLSQQGSRNQSRSGASQSVSGVSAVEGTSTASARINLGLVDTYA